MNYMKCQTNHCATNIITIRIKWMQFAIFNIPLTFVCILTVKIIRPHVIKLIMNGWQMQLACFLS